MMGSPATGRAAFARTSDSGRRRVARPAVRTSAGQVDRSIIQPDGSEHHVAVRQAVRGAMLQEQRAVGISDVVGRRSCRARWRSRECAPRRLQSRRMSPLAFRRSQSRRLRRRTPRDTSRNGTRRAARAPREFSKQRVSIGRHRFVFLSQLHRAGLYGSFEGEKTPAAFAADAQHTAAPIERIVLGIEEAILLEAPSAQRRGSDRQHALSCLARGSRTGA